MDTELKHYGILGMKWGVRKYQNSDGTLTDAGKRRYAKREAKAARKAVREDRKNAAKNRALLSDAELNERINRLQRERTFNELTKGELHPGRKKAGEVLGRFGNQAFGTMLGIGISATAGKMINANMDKWMSGQGYYSKNYVNGVPKNSVPKPDNN